MVSGDLRAIVIVSVAAILFAAGVAVGATRVLLVVHWVTDVVAGRVLGWTWFAVVPVVFGAGVLRFGVPIEAERAMTSTTT